MMLNQKCYQNVIDIFENLLENHYTTDISIFLEWLNCKDREAAVPKAHVRKIAIPLFKNKYLPKEKC